MHMHKASKSSASGPNIRQISSILADLLNLCFVVVSFHDNAANSFGFLATGRLRYCTAGMSTYTPM